MDGSLEVPTLAHNLPPQALATDSEFLPQAQLREPTQACSGAAQKSEVPEESSSHAYRAISKVHMILTFPPFLTHRSTAHDCFLGSLSNTLCEPETLVLVLGSAFWGTLAEISGNVVASSMSVWTNF